MYEVKTLNNGARCVGCNIPDRDSLSIGVWLNAGSRYETEAEGGISHFLEHLLFKGTTKRSGEDIKEAIEGKGGAMNGFTSEEFTCYLVKVLNRNMETAVDVLSDMVLNPRLSAPDIEKERTVIKEEIKMYLDLPSHRVHDLLVEMLWPGQPLGRNIAGTFETVSAITRANIKAYKNKHYNPGNIVISACGNMKFSSFFDCCEKHFKDAFAGQRSAFSDSIERQEKPALGVLSKKTEQVHLAMGMHAVSRRDPDRYALSLLHIILGGNMSSRLFRELREKRGLAYEISTHTKKFYDTGAFLVTAGLDTKKVVESLNLIAKELKKIKAKPVEKGEFIRAKEYYCGQLLLELEDTADHMLWMGEYMTADGNVPTPKEALEKINKITPDDIMRVAKRVFKDSGLNLALIGPINKADEKKISEILTVR